jgi:NADPH2:quinone reductase
MVREFGGPEVMRWEDLPDPVPGPDQVLVQVKASGVNFAETRMRAGTYTGLGLPFVMGMESAGIVEAVGPGVTAFKPGDRVFGRARGSHATKVLFDVNLLMPLPDALSFAEGAAIPVGWHTAWHALVTVANAQPGQRVLIEAVASSVGSAALQIAKHRGCWVAGTASRDDKLARAKAAGADAVYNYKTDDVTARVMADTDGQGLDIGLMTIGEETAASLIASMGNGGKIVMYGSTGGRQVCFDLGIGANNIALIGMSISTSPQYLTETVPTFIAQALPLFAAGTYKAVVDTLLPMGEVARAHAMINDRKHYGKVILTVG